MDNWRDLSGRLEKCSIVATAPLRLDCGGSTDHPITALLGKVYHPATTNLALELRTRVSLQPYHAGKILIEFEGQGKKEIDPCELNFTGSYGLMNAIIAHFGVTGFHLSVNFQAPPYSGLGGSGALCVAVIGALFRAISDKENDSTELSKISILAHNIEDALYGNTGLQDQLAAAFGDVHLWEWDYGSSLNFNGSNLNCDLINLESHILLAYTGEPHPSSEKGSMFLNAFSNGTQKNHWNLLLGFLN
ncbi:MAG: hypothetical protein JW862_02930 [Anaerolineales bacterium]|nr:hypothetical protein [Anaerolineales bacterium]